MQTARSSSNLDSTATAAVATGEVRTGTSRPIVRQHRSEATRSHLLDAALTEFANVGFEAASTRVIAARAGVHQPQINYHFASKDDLWRAVIDQLFAGLAHTMTPPPDLPPGAEAEWTLRSFVRFAAAHPELNRVMVHAATSDSERLDWLVERHVRPRFAAFVAALGRSPHDQGSIVLFYTLVGAASLLYVNAAEVHRMADIDPFQPAVVEAHADLLVRLLLASGTFTPLGPPACPPISSPRAQQEQS